MMRKTVLLLTLLFLPIAARAQGIDVAALKRYAERALPKCAASTVNMESIDAQGLRGFLVYQVQQKTPDPNCGRNNFLLYSPSSQQVMLANVYRLPADSRPVEERVAEFARNALKQPVKVGAPGFPAQDGIRPVSLIKDTPYGPFAYHGWVDASQQYLLVGERGSLKIDPGKTLIDSIGLSRAVRRGNPKAKTTIVELSDFECPTCARAHKQIEPIIAKNLKNVDYYRVDLPLFEHHEWALPAALGARALQLVAPAKYWEYVNFLFTNQETIGKEFEKNKSFDTTLKNFVEDRDVAWKKIEPIYHSASERAAILDQVSRVFDNGISSTPTYIINGQVMGFGPEGTFTIENVKKALGVK
jgi:hypothetical protein